MPIYGEAKKRNMIRSVLPSSRRKGAREDLASIKRNNRRTINRNLKYAYTGRLDHSGCYGWCKYELGRNCEVADYLYVDWFDETEYPDRKIREAVWDRQDGDKVAPLMRWAEAVASDIRQKDRLSHMRAMLPDTTVGRHAVSHIGFLDAFEDPDEIKWWTYRNRNRLTDEEREWLAAARYAVEDAKLREVIASGLLKRFNDHDFNKPIRVYLEESEGRRRIKERYSSVKVERNGDTVRYYQEQWVHRPLLGVHDIPAFISEAHMYSGLRYERDISAVADALLAETRKTNTKKGD